MYFEEAPSGFAGVAALSLANSVSERTVTFCDPVFDCSATDFCFSDFFDSVFCVSESVDFPAAFDVFAWTLSGPDFPNGFAESLT
jgi:hypothetical protein